MRSTQTALPFLTLAILVGAVTQAHARVPRGGDSYYLQAGDVVLMLGDAVTEDAGFYRQIFFADLPDEYPDLVGDRPGADLRGAYIRFVNAGVAGTTAADCARNLGTVLAHHKPTVAVICFGTNDSYRDTASYSSSIRAIVRRLREQSVAVTLMTPPYVNAKEHPELAPRAQVLTELVGQLRRISSEMSLPLADCYEAMREHVEAGKGDLSWGDGVHPSSAGKRMMAARLQKTWGFGKPLLEKPEPKKVAVDAGGAGPGDAADWIDLSVSGNSIAPWKHQGGRAWVEGGLLCATQDADVFYAAKFEAFEFECELKGGGGNKDSIIGINLGQTRFGRADRRVSARILSDGDVHIGGGNVAPYRAGNGAVSLNDWVRLRFSVTASTLKIYANDKEIADVDISGAAIRPGGVYFYPYGSATVRMRNARIRALH